MSNRLQALLNDYTERCADQRVKSEQYAKLWIYMLSILIILFGLQQVNDQNKFLIKDHKSNNFVEQQELTPKGSLETNIASDPTITISFFRSLGTPEARIAINLVMLLLVTIIISLIGYTHLSHLTLLHYLKKLEYMIFKESSESTKHGHKMSWYTNTRDNYVHSTENIANKEKISILLTPLGVITFLAYFWIIRNFFCIMTPKDPVGYYILIGVLITISIASILWISYVTFSTRKTINKDFDKHFDKFYLEK